VVDGEQIRALDKCMIERLANVIYWAGCGLAACCVACSSGVIFEKGAKGFPFAGMMIVIAFLFWLTGRAVDYVLTGR
jgi:hypothetical protein